MGASERANRLKSDLSVFQMSVKHDATRIKADMGRLLVICKTLNDVVIPKANVFLRYGEKLLASDLKATLDACMRMRLFVHWRSNENVCFSR